MEVLVPQLLDVSWEEHLQAMRGRRPLRPFDSIACEFVQEVSRGILMDKSFRQFPELMAMAHWLRTAQIKQLQESFHAKAAGRHLLPRGLVLHFAPSNVDSIFVYSWILSLLVGNSNVVRLSQRRGQQITSLLNLVRRVLAQERFEALAQRNLLVSYGHDDRISQVFSEASKVRVIWGGDETIRRIRAIPLAPQATELVFADRFSLAALEAEAVLAADDSQFERLIHAFYNDAFWFDQMACSSPRLVAWVGARDRCDVAKARFWSALRAYVSIRQSLPEPALGVRRLTTAFAYAANGAVDRIPTCDPQAPFVVHVSEPRRLERELHCGAGFFLETECATLSDLQEFLCPKDQTLTVFGFSDEVLGELAGSLGGSGIDRIVPVGQALDFNWVWDGYDLLVYFTREVTLPQGWGQAAVLSGGNHA